MFLANASDEINFAALRRHSKQHNLASRTAQVECHLTSRRAAAGIDHNIKAAPRAALRIRNTVRVRRIDCGRSAKLAHSSQTLAINVGDKRIPRSRA